MPSSEAIQAEYAKIKNSRKPWSSLSPEATQFQEQLLRRQAILEAATVQGEVLSDGETSELAQLRERD